MNKEKGNTAVCIEGLGLDTSFHYDLFKESALTAFQICMRGDGFTHLTASYSSVACKWGKYQKKEGDRWVVVHASLRS